MAKKNSVFKRGDIVYASLGNYPGSCKQSGSRPCLVVSSNRNNNVAPIMTVCPITTKFKRNPMHITVTKESVHGYFLKESEIMIEQLTIIDKRDVISKYGYVIDSDVMVKVDELLKMHLGLISLVPDTSSAEYDNSEDANIKCVSEAGDPS